MNRALAALALICLLMATPLSGPAGAHQAQAQAHPHDWIRGFNVPGSTTSCCGEADCAPIPYSTAIYLRVGDMMYIPALGRSTEVRGILPSPPGSLSAWGCMTGCLFISQGV
jgi:hypothetical protein